MNNLNYMLFLLPIVMSCGMIFRAYKAEELKEKMNEVIARDPLALIEYWSIDTDFDGNVFRSTWQDYRQNIENDGDPLHVVNKVTLPFNNTTGLIAVRAVDVFGFESEVILETKNGR